MQRRARSVILAFILLALSAGVAQALQGATVVGNAAPVIVGWDLRAGPCGPAFAPVDGAGLRACVRAQDRNGHADLCGASVEARSRATLLLASGQAWSGTLACQAVDGRDAWLSLALPADARGASLIHLHVEDAWGAGSDLQGAGPSGSADARQPDRRAPPAPRGRAGDLLP